MPRKRAESKSLGERILEMRKKRKLELPQLAEQTGLDPEVLEQIEKGKLAPPVGTLIQISKALALDSGALLAEDKKKERQKTYRKRTKSYSYKTLNPGSWDKHLWAYMVTLEPKKKHEMVELSFYFTSDERDETSPIHIALFRADTGDWTETYPFEIPFGDAVLNDLRWYLEEYAQWPSGTDYERAGRVEARLEPPETEPPPRKEPHDIAVLRRARRLRLLAIASALLVVLGFIVAGASFFDGGSVKQESLIFFTVQPRDLPIAVKERGTLGSQNNVEVICEVDDIHGDGIYGRSRKDFCSGSRVA